MNGMKGEYSKLSLRNLKKEEKKLYFVTEYLDRLE